MTGLCILKSIYGYNSLPINLREDYSLLSIVSKNRFNYLFQNKDIFYRIKNNQIKSFPPINKDNIHEFNNFIMSQNLFSSGSKKKRKTKRKNKLKKKSKKNQNGGCNDTQDFWSKLHLYL